MPNVTAWIRDRYLREREALTALRQAVSELIPSASSDAEYPIRTCADSPARKGCRGEDDPESLPRQPNHSPPAPWKSSPLGHGQWITAADGAQIAVAYSADVNPRAVHDLALTLAAPRMLEALKHMDAWWTEDFPDGPGSSTLLHETTNEIWREIRAAIHSAQGA